MYVCFERVTVAKNFRALNDYTVFSDNTVTHNTTIQSGNKFRLIASHHQALTFKKRSGQMMEWNKPKLVA
jgi:hypothetical protein